MTHHSKLPLSLPFIFNTTTLLFFHHEPVKVGGGMSSRREERRSPVRRHIRRKMVLDVDLNAMPPLMELARAAILQNQAQNSEQVGGEADPPPPPAVPTIDVEEIIDDDVVICSPRSFVQAKMRSGRNRTESELLAGNSEEEITRLSLNSSNMSRRVPSKQTIIDCEHYINLESSSDKKKSEPLVPPPKEPTFSCPVCMGPLVEEMSTKCGHIFCKGCISAAIKAQGKCPTCRRKIAAKDTIRIYLPITD